MTSTPLVTVAVLVYNTEKYLHECINSIINQTYQNLEIIFINDCSTDNSLDILKSYSAKDSRIKIITNNKNLRQGASRNVALDIARGEYLLFIDSDDWVDLTLCEKVVNKAKENNADMVFFSAYQVNGEEKKKMRSFCDISSQLNSDDRKKLLLYTEPAAWLRAWRLSFIKKNKLYFLGVPFGEDLFFYWKSCIMAEAVDIVDEFLYMYRQHENQVTKSRNKERISLVHVFNELEEWMKNENYYSTYFETFRYVKFLSYFNAALQLSPRYRNEFIREAKIDITDKLYLLIRFRPIRRSIFLIFCNSYLAKPLEVIGKIFTNFHN